MDFYRMNREMEVLVRRQDQEPRVERYKDGETFWGDVEEIDSTTARIRFEDGTNFDLPKDSFEVEGFSEFEECPICGKTYRVIGYDPICGSCWAAGCQEEKPDQS